MREAIGSSLLLNIVLVMVGVISLILINSIAYSKAFKAKNRIISVIDSYSGECFLNNNIADTDSCFKEIENELKSLGYSSNISASCDENRTDELSGGKLIYPSNNYQGGHKFCVYRYKLCDIDKVNNGQIDCNDTSNEMYYYKVVTFMHFDIPVIGQFLEFPVSGETNTFYDTFVNLKN